MTYSPLSDLPPSVRIQIVDHGMGQYVYGAASCVPPVLAGHKVMLIIMHNLPSSDPAVPFSGDYEYVSRLKPAGFAANHNALAVGSHSDILILLNHDVAWNLQTVEALDQMIRVLDRHPDIGCVAPRLVFRDGTPQESSGREPGILNDLIRGSSPAVWWSTRRRSVAFACSNGQKELVLVDWIPFTAVALRGSLFCSLGGMDERYGMYFEDVDFCRRVRAAGSAIAVLNNCSVTHYLGASYPGKSSRWSAWRQSQLKYLSKWHSPPYRILYRSMVLLAGAVEFTWTVTSLFALQPKRVSSFTRWHAWTDKWRPFRRWTNQKGSFHADAPRDPSH